MSRRTQGDSRLRLTQNGYGSKSMPFRDAVRLVSLVIVPE
jgi:hypothetical protein